MFGYTLKNKSNRYLHIKECTECFSTVNPLQKINTIYNTYSQQAVNVFTSPVYNHLTLLKKMTRNN